MKYKISSSGAKKGSAGLLTALKYSSNIISYEEDKPMFAGLTSNKLLQHVPILLCFVFLTDFLSFLPAIFIFTLA